MQEVKNITQDEVLEMIKDFPVQPRRSRVVITVNVDEGDDIDLTGAGGFAENQYVLAVGSHVTDIVPGQKVLIDVRKMLVPNTDQIEIDPINVGDKIFAFVNEGVIKAVDNRE